MASKAVIRRLGSVGAIVGVGAKRGFATVAPKAAPQHLVRYQQRRLSQRPQNAVPLQRIQPAFRRGYADEAPKVVKKKRFAVLRWTWRLTWLSALGGLGYVGFLIYDNRTPPDQEEPDPNKKTLVVLGMHSFSNVICGDRGDRT